jgi:hypothetical protein
MKITTTFRYLHLIQENGAIVDVGLKGVALSRHIGGIANDVSCQANALYAKWLKNATAELSVLGNLKAGEGAGVQKSIAAYLDNSTDVYSILSLCETPNTDAFRHALHSHPDFVSIHIEAPQTLHHQDVYLFTAPASARSLMNPKIVFASRKSTFGGRIVNSTPAVKAKDYINLVEQEMSVARDDDLSSEQFYQAQNVYMNLLCKDNVISPSQCVRIKIDLDIKHNTDSFSGDWCFQHNDVSLNFEYFNTIFSNSLTSIINSINTILERDYSVHIEKNGLISHKLALQSTFGFLAAYWYKKHQSIPNWLTILNTISQQEIDELLENFISATDGEAKLDVAISLLKDKKCINDNSFDSEAKYAIINLAGLTRNHFFSNMGEIFHPDELYGIFIADYMQKAISNIGYTTVPTSTPPIDPIIWCSLAKYLDALTIIKKNALNDSNSAQSYETTLRQSKLKREIENLSKHALLVSDFEKKREQKASEYTVEITPQELLQNAQALQNMQITVEHVEKDEFDYALKNKKVLLKYLELYGTSLTQAQVINIMKSYSNELIDIISVLLRHIAGEHEISNKIVSFISNQPSNFALLCKIADSLQYTNVTSSIAFMNDVIQKKSLKPSNKAHIIDKIFASCPSISRIVTVSSSLLVQELKSGSVDMTMKLAEYWDS